MNKESQAMYVYIATTFIATCMIRNYNRDEHTFNKYLGKFIKEYDNKLNIEYDIVRNVVDILMDDFWGDLVQQRTNVQGQGRCTSDIKLQELFNINLVEVGGGTKEVRGGGSATDFVKSRNDPMIIKKLREISLKKYNAGSYPDKLTGFIKFLNNKKVDMGHVVKVFNKLEEAVVNAIKELPTEKIELEVNISNIGKIIEYYSENDYIGYSLQYKDTGHFRKKMLLAMFREKTDLIINKNLGKIGKASLQRIIQRADNVYGHFLHIDTGVLGNVVEADGGYVESLLNLLYGVNYIDNSDESEQAFLHAFRYLEGKNDYGKIYDDLGVLGVGHALEMSGAVREIKRNADDRNTYREELVKLFVGLFENKVVQKYKEFNVLRNLLLFLDPNIHERIERIERNSEVMDVREMFMFKSTCVKLVRLVDRLNLNTSINTIRKGFTTRIKNLLLPPPHKEFSQYLGELNTLLANEINVRFIYVQKDKSEYRRDPDLATLEEFIGNEQKYVYRVILGDEFHVVYDAYIKSFLNFTDILLEYASDEYTIDVFMKLIGYINDGEGYGEKLVDIIEPLVGDGHNYVKSVFIWDVDDDEYEDMILEAYKKIKNIFRIWLHLFIKIFGVHVGGSVRGKFGESVDDERMNLQGVIDEINQANGYGLQGNGGGLRGNKMVKKYIDELYTCKDKKKRKVYRVVGEGNRLFVKYKGEHTRVGDVVKVRPINN